MGESKGRLECGLVYRKRNRKRPGVNNAPRTMWTMRIRDAPLRNPRHRTALVTIIELPAAAGDRLRFRAIAVRAEASFSFAIFAVFASQTSNVNVASRGGMNRSRYLSVSQLLKILHRQWMTIRCHYIFQLYNNYMWIIAAVNRRDFFNNWRHWQIFLAQYKIERILGFCCGNEIEMSDITVHLSDGRSSWYLRRRQSNSLALHRF